LIASSTIEILDVETNDESRPPVAGSE